MTEGYDWTSLREAATAVMTCAYAPYSGLSVGAAGLAEYGRIVTGCNVENVSYGLGVCAEVALVTSLVSSGGRRLFAVSVCDPNGTVLTPCGRCRQVLLEFGGPDLLVDTVRGPRTLASLLPDAFGPEHLAVADRRHPTDAGGRAGIDGDAQ